MRADQAARRLLAWHAGKALPLYSTIHFPVVAADDLLSLAFVRMGGESAPWGIAWQKPGQKAATITVPEARNRDFVADMVAQFAPILLGHFRHPSHASTPRTGPDDQLPLRQLWVPNRTHLDMLHFLAYTYSFTKWGEAERWEKLQAVGRLAGWLFREADRPGQVTVMAATDALRRTYSFPAEPVRQAHLGYLLAWLTTRGGRARRQAAAQEAEAFSISTSLDPAVERDSLADPVEKWNKARAAGKPKTAAQEAARIEPVLVVELTRRLGLAGAAIQVVSADRRPINPGVAKLAAESLREHWYQYVRLELHRDDDKDGPAFTPSPETDRHSAAAAARYYIQQASDEFAVAALVHHDSELQDDVIAAGDGIRGEITRVWDEGTGKATRPVWRIEASGDRPLRVREGTSLCVAGLPSRIVDVRSIDTIRGDRLRIEVEVTGLKTRPRGPVGLSVRLAADPGWIGETVTLLPASHEGIPRLKSQRVWDKGQPGRWLTHAQPDGRPTEVEEKGTNRDGDNLFARLARL